MASDKVLFSSLPDDNIEAQVLSDPELNAFIAASAEEDEAPRTTTFLDKDVEMPDVKTKRATKLQTQLEGTYVSLGTMLFMFDQHVGGTIIQQAPECAKALDELAKTNPAVKRALDNAMATSAWSAVIMAHLPIIVMVGTKYVPPLKEKLKGDAEQAQSDTPE